VNASAIALLSLWAGGMASGEADGHDPSPFQHRQALPVDLADVAIGYYGGVC